MRSAKPRLYLLFVHYRLSADERKLVVDPATTATELQDILGKRLASDLKNLNGLLSEHSGWRGQAFVFFDIGWAELVRETLTIATSATIGCAIGHLQSYLSAQRLLRQIRLISMADLVEFTAQLSNSGSVPAVGQFFAGGLNVLHYDAPKVVEAIIRIANLGRHVPLFRFDDDVLFSGVRQKGRSNPLPGFQTKLLRLCQHYDELSQDSDINYFAFSGGYLDKKLERKLPKQFKRRKQSFPTIVNGFATRVLSLATCPPSPKGLEINGATARHFLEGLVSVGTNPYAQVISGAGFCLSDGAILDLPPFSNMRQNVVWIDDHLKYALHHELGHFGYKFGTRQVGRVRDVWFSQDRYEAPPKPADVEQEVYSYLPRLVLGCVADSWLRGTPDLKVRHKSRRSFEDAMKHVPGVYGEAFRKFVGRPLSDNDRQEVGSHLWNTAEIRIKEIIVFFSEFKKTFLKAFVDGSDVEIPLPNFARNGLRKANEEVDWGNVPDFRHTTPLPEDPTLRESIAALVSDFLDYIEFVRLWPEAVFASRLLLNSRDHGARFR